MRVTINIPQRAIYIGGNAHYLSRVGAMIALAWLQDNGRLLWGWAGQELVFEVVTNG